MKAKKLRVIVTALVLMTPMLFVQNNVEAEEINEGVEQTLDKADKEVEKAMKEMEDALSQIGVEVKSDSDETPYMGVYLDDINFEDAYEMHYDYNYGVLLDGVVKGGPADKAGLIKGDIIMEFDGVKTRYADHLSRLITSKNVGDEVEIKFFRDGEIHTTTLNLDKREDITEIEKGVRKKDLDTGWGGGSWIPVWFKPDLDDVNDLVTNLGFSKLRDEGLFMNGGGGKITIGDGLFLGGMGVEYSLDRKIGYSLDDTTMITRRMNYKNSYWGITLDKRIPISRKFIPEIGIMLGWGGHTVEVSQTSGIYDWNEIDDQLNQSVNNSIQLEKRYIFLQPKVACLYRINSWFGIRAEVGYILSHSYHSGWNAKLCGDTFEILNSPDTSYNGPTFTIGPWFGF
ncbi:MAG: PDZ domain-containing protein [Candidatus Cloacimonadia bacterium]